LECSKDNIRQKIIDVSRESFAFYGYYGTSTGSIIKNAGVSKGALYWHFKSKIELFKTILDEEMNLVRKIMIPTSKDLEEKDLRTFFLERGEKVFEYYLVNQQSALLLLQMNLETQRKSGEIASLASEFTDTLIEDLVDKVIELRPGYLELQGELELKELAVLFEAAFNGLLFGLNIRRSPSLTKKLWRFMICQLFPEEGKEVYFQG